MKDIPRLTFCSSPYTALRNFHALSENIWADPRILVKRDDQTGLAFGGNKTRKLEFLVAEALEQGARTLITGGALQSNHCRQTAAAAARFGLDCILVLNGEMPEQPSANLLLDQMFGAEIVTIADRAYRDQTLQETYDKAVADGKKTISCYLWRVESNRCVGICVCDERVYGAECHMQIGSYSAHPLVGHMQGLY